MSNRNDIRESFENSLPSWISEHLREKSYMADENSPAMENNSMTQDNLDRLRESYSFPAGKHCNKLPILIDTKEERTKKILDKIGPGDTSTFWLSSILERSASSSPLATPRCPLVEGAMMHLKKAWSSLRAMRPEAKKVKPNKVVSKEAMWPVAPEEDFSKKPGEVLGFRASVMVSAVVAKNLLARVILPTDKDRVDQLSLDQVVTKFLHILGQGIVLGSPLVVRSRDIGSEASFHVARAESAKIEMVQAQNWTIEMEGLLAEFGERDQNVARVMATLRDDREAIAEKLSKMEMVRRFDFCKRQLAHHHPNLGIDLGGMDMDCDLLEKEEAEENKEQGEGKGDTNLLSP
ncbi:hypothetical protein Acr_00g0047470 [Actinidia rufa]|uniref:Uncharacterized protein n=1 Tax=Actinidia rufa TaxID=165716 RepID=A0A7J0DJZ0_9ERIC|nr:hypothetical protein Acr_00g0047470 [Actinidia rufa]